ncbi:MAG: Type II secretory pathway component PulF-like protein [uncultured bacterium]|nr:MAG: Type II secretory pathway component PulF-like protein [uncultured bacterium]OGT75938.1 MAG: hypothetical protein A3G71_04420 [Gammaproteobacteria bacterium RIFCSPLOWO2_12_FULL_38_14]
MAIDIDLIALVPEQWKQPLQKFQFSAKEQQAFLEDISVLVNDGVTPAYAIEMFSKISKSEVTRNVAKAISLKIAEGKGMAEGMVGWFSVPIVELVRAGEQGGTLGDTLAFAAKTLSATNSIVSSFISALIYPVAVMVMGALVAVFINKSVFVQFREIKPLDQWPTDGQNLVALAEFIQDGWWLILLFIVALLIAGRYFFHNYTGEFRKKIDHLPVLSMYRKLTAARFMETLGMLIANGIAFKKAIKIIQYHTTPYLSFYLIQMDYRLGAGKLNIAEVLDTGLIDEEDIMRLQAVANVKGVEQALIRLGRHAAEKSEKMIKLTGKILGGILLATGGSFAAFMILAIYGVGSSLAV